MLRQRGKQQWAYRLVGIGVALHGVQNPFFQSALTVAAEEQVFIRLAQAFIGARVQGVHFGKVPKDCANAHFGTLGNLLGRGYQVAFSHQFQHGINNQLPAAFTAQGTSVGATARCFSR